MKKENAHGEELKKEKIINREPQGGKTELLKIDGNDAIIFENFGICAYAEAVIFGDEYIFDFVDNNCWEFDELKNVIESVKFVK